MNWDAIGATGEVIGAVAVVLSLLYLAVQVRHNASTTEDSATRDVFVALTAQLAVMAQQENREVILRGLIGYKVLDASDKFAFDHLMGGLITLSESIFISANAAIVQDETMENIAFYMRSRYLAYPGMLEWWEESKKAYIAASQEWIDRQIARTDPDSDFWGIKNPQEQPSETGN